MPPVKRDHALPPYGTPHNILATGPVPKSDSASTATDFNSPNMLHSSSLADKNPSGATPASDVDTSSGSLNVKEKRQTLKLILKPEQTPTPAGALKRSVADAGLGDDDVPTSSNTSMINAKASRQARKTKKAEKAASRKRHKAMDALTAGLSNSNKETVATLVDILAGMAEVRNRLAEFSNTPEDVEMSDREDVEVSDHEDVEVSGRDDIEMPVRDDDDQKVVILNPGPKDKSKRVVEEDDPLLEGAIKASKDIYDTDAEDFDGLVGQNIKDPHLYRNIRWGRAAFVDQEDADFEPTTEFTPFVQGRWERLSDGSLRDQKEKLLVRVISKEGIKKIHHNPPPKDWNNIEALNATTRRIEQQMRRDSKYRFRDRVEPYIQEERAWILTQLKSDGKPMKGNKGLERDFNEKFAGKLCAESGNKARPKRTISSLSKEVSRSEYKKGFAPNPIKDADKRKVGAAKKRNAGDDAAGAHVTENDADDNAAGTEVSKKRKAGNPIADDIATKKRKTDVDTEHNADDNAAGTEVTKKRKASNDIAKAGFTKKRKADVDTDSAEVIKEPATGVDTNGAKAIANVIKKRKTGNDTGNRAASPDWVPVSPGYYPSSPRAPLPTKKGKADVGTDSAEVIKESVTGVDTDGAKAIAKAIKKRKTGNDTGSSKVTKKRKASS